MVRFSRWDKTKAQVARYRRWRDYGRRRSRARNLLRRGIRRFRTRKSLSNRKLTRAVRHLQSASEIKRVYFNLDNVRVSNGNGALQAGQFISVNLSEIPVVSAQGAVPIVTEGRGQNTEKILVKNLHIRMSMHASVGDSRPDNNKYCIYLIRSELQDDSQPTLARPPTLDEFFDYTADFTSTGNLLDPVVDGFRNSESDAITKVKVLKKWSGILTPFEYDLADPNNAAGTANEYEVPTGTGMKPSQKTIHYSTRQLNCEIKYATALGLTAHAPTNQAYYLCAVTNCNELRGEFCSFNVVVATTFKDD